MSRRKDRERYLHLKQQNPDYPGFRGGSAAPAKQTAVEGVTCSVCGRKRNVPASSLPPDRSSYVCLRCQEAAAQVEGQANG